MNKNSKRFALGALFAGIAGYLTGILTAPKSGKETREDVKNAAAKAKREAEKSLKSLHSEATVLLTRGKKLTSKLEAEGKKDLEKFVAAATEAKEKARDMLTALHDGDVEDADLKTAVADVKEAIDHLRAYLDKHE